MSDAKKYAGFYRHQHGTDVAVYASPEQAKLGLLRIVLDDINSGYADDHLALDSQKEIVQAYKEGDYDGALESFNRDSETCTMSVCEVTEDTAEPASADYVEQIELVLEQKQQEEDREYEAEAKAQR
jgi:hypothetical protein